MSVKLVTIIKNIISEQTSDEYIVGYGTSNDSDYVKAKETATQMAKIDIINKFKKIHPEHSNVKNFDLPGLERVKFNCISGSPCDIGLKIKKINIKPKK